MELSNKFLDATWTKDINGKPKFFIINEAIIAKLCILGEEQEPCFEGATITHPTIQFSFDDDFKNQLFSMMNELKDLIKEGGAPVFTTYAVEIGDALWVALYSFLETNFPRDLEEGEPDGPRCSKYSVDSVWEEGAQKFAILRERTNGKLYRLNFSYSEQGFTSDGNFVQVEKTYVPVNANEPTFALEEVEAFEAERYAIEDNSEQEADNETEESSEGSNTNFKEEDEDEEEEEEKCPECGKPVSECTCDKKKCSLNVEEAPEYVELQNNYSELETKYAALETENNDLKEQIAQLTAFKAEIDRKEKQTMIDSFYMLSDDDKADVIANIDTYSIDDIEAKLSIICVRNKVSFNLDDDEQQNDPTTYSLNNGGEAEDYTPAWIKSLRSVAKDIK